MNKRIVVAVALAVFVALIFAGCLSSTHLTTPPAQTTDIFELVKTGTPQSVQGVIDKGADLNAQDNNGLTPLMYAAQKNQNPEMITALLNAGSDINARDKTGLRP